MPILIFVGGIMPMPMPTPTPVLCGVGQMFAVCEDCMLCIANPRFIEAIPPLGEDGEPNAAIPAGEAGFGCIPSLLSA
jgi:hypothetical protein